SPLVSPSPRPLSGSLLVIEVSTNVGDGSHTSCTATAALMPISLWLGGQSRFGLTEALIDGGCVSATVTVETQFETLPESSATVKLTGVTPSGKKAGALLVGVRLASQISVAETPAKNGASWGSFAAMPLLPVHSTLIGAGQTSTGGVVSCTRTLKLHC